MFPSLVKIPFLVANLVFVRIVMTAPNPPADASETRKFEAQNKPQATQARVSPMMYPTMAALQGIMQAMNLIEIYLIVSMAYPLLQLPQLPSFLQGPRSPSSHVTTTFLAGWTLACLGSLLRASCYRHLGKYFTLELTLREGHKLITDGPYSVVRHPSYTAVIAVQLGLLMCQFGSGSWWGETGMWSTVQGMVIGGFRFAMFSLAMFVMIGRTGREDAVLKAEFGKEWVGFSQRTPYKLVPFVF